MLWSQYKLAMKRLSEFLCKQITGILNFANRNSNFMTFQTPEFQKKNLTRISGIKNRIGIPLPMGVPAIGTKIWNSQPSVGGLCLTVDFNQMWSKHVPLVGGLCHAADFDQMWSKHVPLDGGLCFANKFDHKRINNGLIIEKGRYQTNGLEASIDTELKPPSSILLPYDQYTGRYLYQGASTKKNDASRILHGTNDK